MPYEWTLTPYGSVRWATQSFDGYTEAGSSANATVGDHDASVLEARAQVTGEKQIGIADLSLRTGIQFRSAGDDDAQVTMIGQTQSIPSFADDRTSVFIGGAVGFAISDTSMLAIDAEAVTGDGMTSFSGIIKFSSSF
jgi:outer membrane autotransporter protein